MKRLILGMAAVLAIGVGGLMAIGPQAESASAAPAPPQCNGEMNVGGQEVRCTVVVENYIAVGGGLAITPLSTLSMTRCVGAADSVTCETTVTTLTSPVTSVAQCNGSANGAGGIVRCVTTINNHFEGSVPALLPATVYQCVGSVITGPGEPGTCTPANTPDISSVGEATVGQCNGSGNGGTNVSFTCTVTIGSTMAATFPINIDQCNGSGEGGGALVNCSATVTNVVFQVPATETPTPTATQPATQTPTEQPATQTPTEQPPAATPTSPAATPTSPAATPTSPAATPTLPVPGTPTVPPASQTPRVPNTTPQAQNPPTQVPPTIPGTTPESQVPPSVTPGAPATGTDSAFAETEAAGFPLPMLGLILVTMGIGGLWFAGRAR